MIHFSAREYVKSRVGDKGYLVEASIRRILDIQGGLLGYTPAILAAENGNDKILKFLLDTGASELAIDSVRYQELYIDTHMQTSL